MLHYLSFFTATYVSPSWINLLQIFLSFSRATIFLPYLPPPPPPLDPSFYIRTYTYVHTQTSKAA